MMKPLGINLIITNCRTKDYTTWSQIILIYPVLYQKALWLSKEMKL